MQVTLWERSASGDGMSGEPVRDPYESDRRTASGIGVPRVGSAYRP